MRSIVKLGVVICLIVIFTSIFIVGCDRVGTTIGPRQIAGTVLYNGVQTGTVYVTCLGQTSNTTSIGSKGSFIPSAYFVLLPKGTYTVSAYMDVNGDARQEADEPAGFYDKDNDGKPDNVVVNVQRLDIDITLRDP